MWESFLNFFPSALERWLMTAGAAVGGLLGAALGEHATLFYWLFGFVVADYLSGMYAAIVRCELSSAIGFRGLIKKVVIILLCFLFHGLDQITGWAWIGSAVIVAFCVNELISILENVERAGFGGLLPKLARNILEVVKEQQEAAIKNKMGVKNE